MNKVILYHGSETIIENPQYEIGKPYNDYGVGFYMTKYNDLAKEWACSKGNNGFSNRYQLDYSNLKVCDLTSNKYNTLNWLALLLNFRDVRISTPIMESGKKYLIQNYYIDVNDYDLIIGYRADDSFFSFARSFILNEISLNQLNQALSLGALNTQYVLKSKKGFSKLTFLDYESVDSNIYFAKAKKRDLNAREQYNNLIRTFDKNGKYIKDIIEENERTSI